MENNTYYGAPENTDNKTLYERLRDYYEPSDFVQVQNVDTEPLTYQFMDPKNEQFVQNAPYHGEIHHTAPPTVVTLQPGETKLCPAFEADRMITTLIKKVTANATAQKIAAGELRPGQAANWSDPSIQKALISKIFLGKQDLVSQYNQQLHAKPVEAATANIEKDLGLDEPRRGRPPKAQQTA